MLCKLDVMFVFILCGLVAVVYGQPLNGLRDTGYGMINGREVRLLDDVTNGGVVQSTFISDLPFGTGDGVGVLRSRHRGSGGSMLRGGSRGGGGGWGGSGGRGGSGVRLGSGTLGGLSPIGSSRSGMGLRPCRRNLCTMQFIRPRCRYTPVMSTRFGNQCLGCPLDVCETRGRRTPRQRRRRRRLRRQLCRQFGICFGPGSGLGSGLGSGRGSGFGSGLGIRSPSLLGRALP